MSTRKARRILRAGGFQMMLGFGSYTCAGAATMAQLAIAGLPALFVPLRSAAQAIVADCEALVGGEGPVAPHGTLVTRFRHADTAANREGGVPGPWRPLSADPCPGPA
jgi:hypothetical protein